MKLNKKYVLSISIICLITTGFSACLAGDFNSSVFRTEKKRIGFRQALVISDTVKTTVLTNVFQTSTPTKAKAFLLSLAVPGMGEFYAGSKRMGTIFLCTEIALWAGYFAFQTYGDWKEQDFKQYATAHAGVHTKGKNHRYFVNIEHFDNVRAYNEAKLQQRDPNALYPENDEYSWQWDKTSHRLKYEKMRVASDQAYSRAVLMIGVIVANHIISGIDAIRVVRQVQKNTVQVGLRGRVEGGVDLCFSKSF